MRTHYHELGGDPFVVSDEQCIKLTQTGKQRFSVLRRRTVDGCEELVRALTSVDSGYEAPLTVRRAALVDGSSKRCTTSGS